MNKLISIVISLLTIALFLYTKLHPYKDKLHPKYKRIFSFFDSVFYPIFNFLRRIVRPFPVGARIFIDMPHLILLIIFLVLLNVFK